jgi:NADH:ubiquinone oxidoreductase subunit
MTLGTRIFTWLYGRKVGSDSYGNLYYTEKTIPTNRRAKRWMIFHGQPEASKVPPEWHGWLHHVVDTLPESAAHQKKPAWIKPHQPNLTGTKLAWRPLGHVLRGGHRPKAIGDYQAWQPPE